MKRIAIVDDDHIFQFTTKVKIEKLQLAEDIQIFNDGEEIHQFLLNASDQELPEVILLDINMPIVDGWDFLNLFSQMPEEITRSIQIFMLSSSINPVDVDKAKENSFVKRYVTKPIKDEVLQEILQ